MSVGKVIADIVDQAPKTPMSVPDDLLKMSKKIGDTKSDREIIQEGADWFRTKATLNRNGSLRTPRDQGGPGITYLRELAAKKDIRSTADAVRNLRSFQFTKDGSGAGGTGNLTEALTKPGWAHSGRQVKVVMMTPHEYLQRSAKGHGISYDQLRLQIAQGERTDDILRGMAEGEQFAMPYLDYRGGSFGQEGQHRAMAAAMTGQEKIPVAVMWDDVKTPVAAKAENTRRIDEQGFDTDKTFLHGTQMKQETVEGMTEFRGTRGVSVHVTDKPEVSDIFAGQPVLPEERAVVFPVHLKKGRNTFDKRNSDHVETLKEVVKDRAQRIIDGDPDASVGLPSNDADRRRLAKHLNDMVEEDVKWWDFSRLEAFKRDIEEAGFDSYVDFEAADFNPTGIAVFNPEDVKSTMAPGKGAGTFAGATGAAVGLSQPDSAQAGTPGTLESEFAQIASDEGTVHESYLDTRGLPTAGIGHLLTKEEQKKYPIGTKVPDAQVQKWWEEDRKKHMKDLDQWEKAVGPIPDEVQKILFNMSFNMGPNRFSPKKWPGLTRALKAGDWEKAADEMVNSDWYSQVGNRSRRLVNRMRGVR